MKEWFKARNVWGAAIRSLPDEDAGRLAKAIWTYTMDGDVVNIEGAGQGALSMIMLTLRQDDERDMDLSEKRAAAGSIGGQHNQANRSKGKQTVANQANATNKNQNKNKNIETEQETETELFIEIQRDHDRILSAAEDAGFARNDATRAKLIALYADNGLQKVLDGIESCVEHGAPSIAYLRAVLKGEPKKAKADVNAQKYAQRDYADETQEAMLRMIKGVI